ncbi:hypothetical protein XBO1_2110079 [Xenorhabdus bovienii str. oregonense]|uniref:Uncharacterized protein n=1 Tax=Xenorhabdus bovienii str. oregonense TaxID=1398202 RepID=A0A077P8L8_XENBV|nr:hypothetical protein XBO1_2110079 [Xenorhabdus bovienii str. oregonense]
MYIWLRFIEGHKLKVEKISQAPQILKAIGELTRWPELHLRLVASMVARYSSTNRVTLILQAENINKATY